MNDVFTAEVDEPIEYLNGKSPNELTGKGSEFIGLQEVVQVQREELECHTLYSRILTKWLRKLNA